MFSVCQSGQTDRREKGPGGGQPNDIFQKQWAKYLFIILAR